MSVCKQFNPLGFALLAWLGTAPALAGVTPVDFRLDTTRQLYDVCAAVEGSRYFPATRYVCRGFIEGAVEYHDAVTERKDLKRLVCYPPTATIEDARQAFVHWAEVHIEDGNLMSEAPVVGLMRALAQHYPCAS